MIECDALLSGNLRHAIVVDTPNRPVSRVKRLKPDDGCIDEPAESLAGSAREQVEWAFHRLREPIFRYVAMAYRHPGEAEEITQDVFVRLYIQLRDGKKIENIRVWAFTVARNSAITAIRKRRTFAAVIARIFWNPCEETIADTRLSIEQRLIAEVDSARQTEMVVRIHQAIHVLTKRQRECFCLRLEGLCYREIAETLGISLQGAVNGCERAVGNIRKRIGA